MTTTPTGELGEHVPEDEYDGPPHEDFCSKEEVDVLKRAVEGGYFDEEARAYWSEEIETEREKVEILRLSNKVDELLGRLAGAARVWRPNNRLSPMMRSFRIALHSRYSALRRGR